MMSSTNDTDPFIQFQLDVQTLLSQTRTSFSSYLRILSLSPSRTSPELLSARQDLDANLADLSTDLTDLTQAVQAVERDPFRYGLQVEEVLRRREWVKEVVGEVEDIQDELRKSSFAAPPPPQNGIGGGEEQAGEGGYEAFERQQQEVMFREQDQMLEGVSRTVGNLREQAHVLGRELEEQVVLLGEVEDDADRIEGKLKRGVKDLSGFIKKNEDTASSCCIGVLIMVLIVLLVVVLII